MKKEVNDNFKRPEKEIINGTTFYEHLHTEYMGFKTAIKFWQKISLMFAFLFFISIIGFIYEANKSKTIPYVLKEYESGNVVGAIPQAQSFTVGEKQIRYFLTRILYSYRNVPSDNNYYLKNIKSVSNFITVKAQNKFINFIKEFTNTKAVLLDNGNIDVKIVSYVKIDKDKYQITWLENTQNKDGLVVGSRKYVGVFFVAFKQVNTIDDIEKNPIGFVVYNVEFSTINNDNVESKISSDRLNGNISNDTNTSNNINTNTTTTETQNNNQGVSTEKTSNNENINNNNTVNNSTDTQNNNINNNKIDDSK